MKNILVVGMQTSGISATKLLSERGFAVRCYDDKVDCEDNWKEKGDEVFENLDYMLISPAIQNTHHLVVKAKELNIPIISELDLGGSLLTSDVIMITGTNGKTTTVDMIDKGLNIMGKKSATMGNIGYPVCQVILDKTELEYAVIEASSFQLEYTSHIHPKITALLNLAPDHIDRYNSYGDYVNAKKRVFLNQTENDYAILNYDSRAVREIASTLKSQIVWVSLKEEIGEFYLKNNYYYYKGEPLINSKEARVKGEHNKYNLMVALNVMNLLGGKKEHFSALVRDYKLLPHRVEFVCTINGKSIYNDSKGTNISACEAAISAVNGRVGLILGGSDKHEEFCEFFDALDDKVNFVAVTGGNEEKIFSAAMKVGYQSIAKFKSLKDAVDEILGMDDIDTVLFSPASASFDKYSSYVERGEFFKELVYAIKN